MKGKFFLVKKFNTDCEYINIDWVCSINVSEGSLYAVEHPDGEKSNAVPGVLVEIYFHDDRDPTSIVVSHKNADKFMTDLMNGEFSREGCVLREIISAEE